MTPLETATAYLQLGLHIVPVPLGEKVPNFAGWPDFNVDTAQVERQFAGKNVAMQVGAKSGGHVDIDLDCFESIQLADLYLPVTDAEFGRASKPRSHRLFIAPGAIFEAFADPASGEMLLELRADGRTGGAHLTLLPPSVTGGELRSWHGDTIAAAVVSAAALRLAAAWLAIGCLVMRYVSEHAARRPGPNLPQLLWEFDHELGRTACRWLGRPDPDAPERYPRRQSELSRRDLSLAEIVAAIPNNCSWEDWNRIGLAIYAASGGSGDGFIVFDDFSAKSPKYNPHEVQKRWFNYRRSPPSRIGMGTLARLARQAGWRPRGTAGAAS
jgi:hypothetical protein